jgi:hypothetical protein
VPVNPRARTLAAATVIASFATCAAIACSFPDASFVADEAGAPDAQGDSPVDAAPVPVDAEAGAIIQDDVDPDAGNEEASTRPPDSGVVRPDGGVDASACTPECDCDHDSHRSETCSSPPKDDCDDFDPLVHPGSGFVAATWDPASPHKIEGDWDCNGTTLKQFNHDVPCGLLSNCGEGFKDDPDCGVTATYNHCQTVSVLGLGLLCQVGSTEQRTQACK